MRNFKDFDVGETLFRHGDVHLKKTKNSIDQKNTFPIAVSGLLHKGQNHHHMVNGSFYTREEDGRKFLGIIGQSILDHEEHGQISIDPAEIESTELQVDIQLEYDHFLEESRQVID